MTVELNRKRGLIAEVAACDRWPARQLTDTPDDTEWADIEFQEEVDAPIGLIPDGTKGEVKSCIPEYGDCYGKWWIRRRNHQRLLEDGGVYIFAIIDPDTHTVLRMGLLDATDVDVLIDEWWECGDGGHTAQAYRQLPWTTLFTSTTRSDDVDETDTIDSIPKGLDSREVVV